MTDCTDPIIQWIKMPDDPPNLPPVDEDIFGLKNLANLGEADLCFDAERYEPSSGLLLGPCYGDDAFDAIALDAGQDAFSPMLLDSYSSQTSCAGICPPGLSPDSSPTSIASSTPWLRTPTTDASPANVSNLTSVDALWEITDAETCLTIHLVDRSGNNLEDVSSQVQDMMPEDIACTPQVISDASFHFPNALLLVTSPHCASASLAEAAPLGPTDCMSPAPSPHTSQSLFTCLPATCYPQETQPPGYTTSPSLSPLSTVSFFSQSPSASPGHFPLTNYSSLSPALSPLPLSDNDKKAGAADAVSSIPARVTPVRLRGKRGVGIMGRGASPYNIPRRSKAKNGDDDEWNPGSERVKRPKGATVSHATNQTALSNPNCPPDESLILGTGQGSGGHSDTTHTRCEHCGQGFTRISDYNRHLENSASHPETRKVWPCPHCDSVLSRKDALGRHIKTHHPGRPAAPMPEGVSGSRLPGGRQEPSVRMVPPRRQPMDTRRYR